MNHETPIALAAYEALAERYAAIAENKAENGYIEHPAMRAAIGPVNGLHVLEAGCGPGFLADWLVSHGAKVTAFDVSPNMIALAKQRTQDRAELFLADMAKPLPFLPDEGFDLVVSSLAIDYVRDWSMPLSEFYRVLKPEGRFVFSVQHPISAFLWYNPPSAFGVQYVETKWHSFGGEPVVVPDYYRSFEEMMNPLVGAGFSLQKVSDTKPIEDLKELNPDSYEKFSRQPLFMIIEAIKCMGSRRLNKL